MQYQINKRKDIVILKLSGEITIYQLQQFQEAIEAIKKQYPHFKNVLLDLKKVNYLDALALGNLSALSRELREKGGDVKIIHMNQDIKTTFDLAYLSKIYEIYNNLDQAIKSFS